MPRFGVQPGPRAAFEVKNDPGVPLVYAGYALLMPATLLSVLPFVQVHI